ncbi:MAG: AraC family transcriptional regulator [Flavobacteriales bacterium]|nr:AraC family transcriptional regulator [Flavobacteriales bacterium]
MKVLPFKIPKTGNALFQYQEDVGDSFYDKFHAHEEIQISFVEQGSGELIVGDAITTFEPGDVFVIGSNVPHLLRSDLSAGASFMRSLFFTEPAIRSIVGDQDKLNEAEQFFNQINRGIRIQSNLRLITSNLQKIYAEQELLQMVSFFETLHALVTAESEPISSFTMRNDLSETGGIRLSKVFDLLTSEYHREISLNEVAEVANLTPNAFCRYFKQHTNKTFFEFLVEVRLANACKLLVKHNDMSIAEVRDLSGFRNSSHFNKKFKAYKGVSPVQYRQAMGGHERAI